MLASISTSIDGDRGTTGQIKGQFAALSETSRLWVTLLAIDAAFGIIAVIFDFIGGPGAGTDSGSKLFNLLGAFLGIYVLLVGVALAVVGTIFFVNWSLRRS